MGKTKIFAGLVAGVLVTSGLAGLGGYASAKPQPHKPRPQSAVFTPGNPGPFTIIDSSAINVGVAPQNAAGVVTDVTVTINDLGHTWPDDIDMELVGPTGIAVPLMSDMCGSLDVEDIDLTFSDAAGSALPDNTQCSSSTVKPGNINDGTDSWPITPNATTLSAFDGTNPNGSWALRVVDDTGTDVGDIEGGFTLTIVTAPFSILIPGTGSSGPALPYPYPIPVSGKVGKVADVNLTLPQLTQQYMEDLDIVLVAPDGHKAMVVSDICVGAFVTQLTYTVDDEAATGFPAGSACPAGSYKPTDVAPGDVMQAPAPTGPYTVPMSTFDGIDPNGTWLLYIRDDLGGGNGFVSSNPTLNLTMTDTTPPDTLLVGKKPENTTKTKAKIKFTSNEPGSTFKCKVDKKAYKSCTSALKLKNLKVGKHKVLILATDAAGNKETKALRIKWRVFPKK